MNRKTYFSLLFCYLLLTGCLANESSNKNGDQNPGNSSNHVTSSKNEIIEIGEIELSDFSLLQVETSYTYNLFGNIYDAQKYLGNFEPKVLYEHPVEDFIRLAQQWPHIYIKWLKGSGAMLTIVVEKKGFETKRGIEIGDSISDIDVVYGKDSGYRSTDKIEFDLGNEEYETMMALVFHIENSIVVKIELTEGT